ncbi:MAG: hypothetical protein CVU41_09995 [Chloroflexi bacterium HGW-Chloroflexi-3]|nr:MAG: hypothetical protein CVU41_09995 [Chloroflexi bacterium HGW-Chloroflexi-3]
MNPSLERCLEDLDAIKKLITQGVPDLKKGYGVKVLAMGDYFKEIGKQYPKIGSYVHVYHPDLQGPMDICELVWGRCSVKTKNR